MEQSEANSPTVEQVKEKPRKLSKQTLIESGAHFGHKTKDWHPKAFPYLYGIHNDIHIIDMSQSLKMWYEIRQRIVDVVSSGMEVLFVGTKKQATAIIKREAEFCGMPYVHNKWKGGTLTNLPTMLTRVARLKKVEKILSQESLSKHYVKKELVSLEKERQKLQDSLGGIRNMQCYPGMLFVVDANREHIAVREAKNLGIPVFSILDSNINPDSLDFFLPANDDAYKTVDLITSAVADAVLEGKEKFRQEFLGEGVEETEELLGPEEDLPNPTL